MISKNLIKYIHSLELKKNRNKEQVFVAEGPKVVHDLMERFSPIRIIAVESWFEKNHIEPHMNDVIVTEEELAKVSFLQHPQQVLATFEIPSYQNIQLDSKKNLYIALDDIQDPGNLGTIIRIADWFGINTIICSQNTADAYNPKVIQATMGSIARVKVMYTNLVDFIKNQPSDTPIYGTFLDGENIYKEKLQRNGIIVMGNEGNGISEEVGQFINRKLLIPNYPIGRPTADSLNVAIATAITCSEFRRR